MIPIFGCENIVMKTFRVVALTGRRFGRVLCPVTANASTVIRYSTNSAQVNSRESKGKDPLSIALDDARTHEPELNDNPDQLFPTDIEERAEAYRRHKQDQANLSLRPKMDAELTSIVLFPGQGSQFVGMGKNLLHYPNVREMFDTANAILGYNLLDLCLRGPKDKLDSTLYSQPAMLVTSLAAAEKLKDNFPMAVENCVAAAGLSVGEYSALVFAGALSYEQAVRLVATRAKLMHEASEQVPGGMLSVFIKADTQLGLACKTAEQYCRTTLGMENPVCRIANYLSMDCKVISGNKEALDFIVQHQSEFRIRRLRPLPVSGAFHTALMASVAGELKAALRKCSFSKPLVSVHCNVNGKRYASAESIPRLLTQQIYSPVKWEQIMHILYERRQGDKFPKTYEVGPGKQLGSLLRVVNAKASQTYYNIDV